MKLWDKGYNTDDWIERFTVGKDRDLDLQLARWDVLGSLAHVRMLKSIDLLTEKECEVLDQGLKKILEEIEDDRFSIDTGVEDVHSQVELLLTDRLGNVGKKIHSGRSRNDQVLVDLKLFFRSEISQIVELVKGLSESLLEKAETYQSVLMPGYTHMQVAMPSSFGLWFSAWSESLAEDMELLNAAWNIANYNPLGSAAGYGSSFPLDRQMTSELLGFSDLSYNSITSQIGRGKTERSLAFAMASIAGTMGKMAMDICLYAGQNFDFFRLPKELTTGSSIMPHKSNPDVFEILRGKANLIQALPNTISLLTGNLPAGYHRDLQLLKEEIFPRLEDLKNCLAMTRYAVKKMQVNDDIITDSRYDYLFTVEEVNRMVREGTPFRDAYKQVAKMIEEGMYVPSRQVDHIHSGSIGNLELAKIRDKMNRVIGKFEFHLADNALKQLRN